MHEMSLAEGVMQIVEEQARTHGCRRVSAIRLEVGQLAGVEIEALRFALEAVTRNTVADGARVEVDLLPGRAWCPSCEAEVTVSERYELCPRCGGFQLQVTGGAEMRVKELAVE